VTAGPYPRSIAEIDAWAHRNGTTGQEARRRFIQFVVMEAVAAGAIGRRVVFKGGNALMLAHGSPRSTLDLDFSADGDVADDRDTLQQDFATAIRSTEGKFGVRMRVQSVKRKPKQIASSTWPTYELKIGYQLPGDRHFRDFDSYARPFNDIVKVDVSLNDVVCEMRAAKLLHGSIRICSLNDIVAEKLRALLQQPIRNRNRCQDAFDIARIMRDHRGELDLDRVSRFLIEKAAARAIDARKSAFDAEVRKRASIDYEVLTETIGDDHADIAFDDAWAHVLELVQGLSLPE